MARNDREKLDLYREYAAEYAAARKPVIVELRPGRYLAISGKGEPGGPAFQRAIGALYNVAFTVKMARKFSGRDYAVAKLEGLWWGKGKGSFLDQPKRTWNWKLMIRTPDFVTEGEVAAAKDRLRQKGKPAEVSRVALEPLHEKLAVQMLHVGPYDAEPASLEQMQDFARARRLALVGKHHEIYLSDPRRVAPSRLRTILRLPAQKN